MALTELDDLLSTNLVLEAGEGDPEDLEQGQEPVVRQLRPPLLQHGLLHVLEDPEEAEQQVPGRLLLQNDRTFGLQKNTFCIIEVYQWQMHRDLSIHIERECLHNCQHD